MRTYLYRVNFGNGQVYEPAYPSKAACWRYISQLDSPGGCFVEFQDPDTLEWFSTGRPVDAEYRDIR